MTKTKQTERISKAPATPQQLEFQLFLVKLALAALPIILIAAGIAYLASRATPITARIWAVVATYMLPGMFAAGYLLQNAIHKERTVGRQEAMAETLRAGADIADLRTVAAAAAKARSVIVAPGVGIQAQPGRVRLPAPEDVFAVVSGSSEIVDV